MDWLFSLKVFTIVVETGKMTSAGTSIFLTQPAISMQIKSLEDFYDIKLFTRHSEGLKPTEEGKALYSRAKIILQMFDEINAEMKTLFGKTPHVLPNNINVGSCILISETYMPWILQKFIKEYPDFSINFSAMDYQSNIKSLLEGRTEAAIIGFRDTSDSATEVKLKFEKCSKEQLEIVVPRNYGLQNMQKINIKFLMGKKFISLKPECGISCVLRQILKSYNVTLKDFQVMALFGSGSAVKLSIVEGLGWSILPKHFVSQEVSEGKVNAVRLEGMKNPFYRWLYLVHPISKKEVSSTKLFLEFVRKLKGSYCSIDTLKRSVFKVEKS